MRPGTGEGDPLPVGALILVGLSTLALIGLDWGRWGADMAALYFAGWFWQAGTPDLIYDAPPAFFGGPPESWFPAMQALGAEGRDVYPYLYPPLWAVLAAPLTQQFSATAFFNGVIVLNSVLLGLSVLLAARLGRAASQPAFLYCLVLVAILHLALPARFARDLIQPTIAAGFLTLLSMERLAAGRPIAAGASLALAAALKLTPAVFVVIFLWRRAGRATTAFLGFGLLLALASLALAGLPLHANFIEALGNAKSALLISAANVSLASAVAGTGAALGLGPPTDLDAANVLAAPLPGWITPAVLLLTLLLLAAVRNRETGREGHLGVQLFAVSTLLALFGPLGWQHYYLLPLLLLPGLIAHQPRSAILFLAGAGCLLFGPLAPALLPFLPLPALTYTWLAVAFWFCALFQVVAGPAAAQNGRTTLPE